MSHRFKHLLSPLRVGNHILKNRMIVTPSTPPFIQGPERYPAESHIQYMANLAQNGAAIVTCACVGPDGMPAESSRERNVENMNGHRNSYDLHDSLVQHYFSALADAIHFYGSIATMELVPNPVPGYDISTGIPSIIIPRQMTETFTGKEMPEEMFLQVANDMAGKCLVLKDCGFDGVYIHMAYRVSLLARSLSKRTNKRTDTYGGSLPNRCRLPFMVCDRIKEICGRDFIIEASITAYDPAPEGWTLEETAEFMKLAEGHIDIVQIRTDEIDPAHPTGYTGEARPFTYMAEVAKKADSSVFVTTVGGLFDPDESEKILAGGKADLIGMARPWISNPDYGTLVLEERTEELIPCIRCNKCLRTNYEDPFVSVCSVNPKFLLGHRLDKLVSRPLRSKKVAIIGGGPAGMNAALTALERDHRVTLFEGSAELGGTMNVADIADFKWPIRDFKEYITQKTMDSDVEVRLNTKATPEMIKNGGYDVVIAAIGAEPIIPSMSGITSPTVVFAADVYNNEEMLGSNVVVVGGGEIGVETALHINSFGRTVTVVEMRDMLAMDAAPMHYYGFIEEEWKKRDNFFWHINTTCLTIENGGIACSTPEGKLHIHADTVVIAAGYRAKIDEAFSFSGMSPQFFAIGDCGKVGSIQTAMRTGFTIGSSI